MFGGFDSHPLPLESAWNRHWQRRFDRGQSVPDDEFVDCEQAGGRRLAQFIPLRSEALVPGLAFLAPPEVMLFPSTRTWACPTGS
jgi:hypothetical protein